SLTSAVFSHEGSSSWKMVAPEPVPEKTVWEYARRRRGRALGYLRLLRSSRSATRRGLLEVGRALRAVDPRLKADWINWAENGACIAEGVHQKNKYQDASSIDIGHGCVGVGLARTSCGAATTTRQGHAEASLGRRSADRSNSLHRRRRRLRAWCDKAWGSFRPATNADHSAPTEEPPARELLFIRKNHLTFVGSNRDARPLVRKEIVEKGPAVAAAQETGKAATQGEAVGNRTPEHRAVLVPCLRCARGVGSVSAPRVRFSTATAGAQKKQEQPGQGWTTKTDEASKPSPKRFLAVNHEGSSEREGARSVVPSEGEESALAGDIVQNPRLSPGDGANEQEGRVEGVVAASVRAGDWILPARGLAGVRSSSRGGGGGGGGTTPARGGRGGSRWLRVEAVSIGKEESIILATQGTGETRSPELRASLKLLEVSIAALPGSLVVRQTPSPIHDHVVGRNEDAKEAEGGFTEAFRLPVLCAQWGLSLLRQWAADDTVFSALERSSPSEEDAQRPSNVHENDPSGARRREQARATVVPCKGSSTTARASSAGTRGLGHGGGDLRLTATPRERELSLALEATPSVGEEVAVDLFTPGSRSQWTALYRGPSRGKLRVDGLDPCHRYRFRSRLSTSMGAGRRWESWRHASFCTLPERPPAPVAAGWLPGGPALSAETPRLGDDLDTSGGNSRLRRLSVLSGGDARGKNGSKNLRLKIGVERISTCGRHEGIPVTSKTATRNETEGHRHKSAEDCGMWVVECHARLRFTGGRAWCTDDRTALEWAGGVGGTKGPAECGVNSAGAAADDRNNSSTTVNLCRSVQGDGDSNRGGQELRREESTDAGAPWELVYRGRRSECVVGSLSLVGSCYVFRCARENADGQVGPWSTDLRCTVPGSTENLDRRSSGGNRKRSASDNRKTSRADPHVARDAARLLNGIGSSDAIAGNQPRPMPESKATEFQPRFNLLVPALVDAFARLAEDGDRWIGSTRSVPRRPPPRRAVASSTPAAISAAPPAATADPTSTQPAHDREPHHGASSKGSGSAQQGDTAKMVWDEHWDSERRVPFFNLRGRDLSVWQIPAL
ncbi:unnamed protein product, partial [Ectocarpus sp. 12 AP-2014]